ncbi:MAG TPA: hypothetical protein GX507_10735 [Clostridia bacterium]|nr:hypothetical protein [Clostridia bacterium]
MNDRMTARAGDAASSGEGADKGKVGGDTFLAGILDWLTGIAYAHRDGS